MPWQSFRTQVFKHSSPQNYYNSLLSQQKVLKEIRLTMRGEGKGLGWGKFGINQMQNMKIGREKSYKKSVSLRHQVFPGGHPSKY